jgi:hypothetical protein
MSVRKVLVLAGLAAGLLTVAACGKEEAPPDAKAAAERLAPGASGDADLTKKWESPSDPVLGPDGFGKLKLGATDDEVKAVGLTVTTLSSPADKDCPKAEAVPLTSGAMVDVSHSSKLGVSVIAMRDGMHTPEGIKIDSKLAEVRKAYPRLKNELGDPAFTGVNYTPVPGNPKAKYRIFIIGGEVSYLHLMLANNDCTV